MRIFSQLKEFIKNIPLKNENLYTKKLFRVVLLIWTLVHTFVILPYKDVLFTKDALQLSLSYVSRSNPLDIFSYIDIESVATYWWVLLIGQFFSVLIALRGRFPFLSNFFVLFFTVNINTMTQTIQDGGNQIAVMFLVLNCFLNISNYNHLKSIWKKECLISISNGVFFLMKAHVMLLYLTTVISKLNGIFWKSGMALYYIFQSNEFSHPLIFKNIHSLELLLVFMTYSTIIFQFTFPFLIHKKDLRLPYIIFGMSLHIGIIFFMGLFTFGLLMAIIYVMFFTNNESKFILEIPHKILS